MPDIAAGDYLLGLDPGRGGSIARFEWRGEPLMRATCGPSILDTACFPLVPFSNRIAFGEFPDGERTVRLAPNFPGQYHPHPLHGFGWLQPWEITERSANGAVLRHHHLPGEWPWEYVAHQRFRISADGLSHELSVCNLSDRPMPAGLGFHPYFPCNVHTTYLGLHRGEWPTSPYGLPLSLEEKDQPIDWWGGKSVTSRHVDTVYTDRRGPLAITWPDRNIALHITVSDNLPQTVIYTPPDANYFCAEPVSHLTNALNQAGQGGMKSLAPNKTFTVTAKYRAHKANEKSSGREA